MTTDRCAQVERLSGGSVWKDADLETVNRCPVCGASDGNVVIEGVKDWFFSSDQFSWKFWQCTSCGSLYLNPRPGEDGIGKAYSSYYTHGNPGVAKPESVSFRVRLANEYNFRKFKIVSGPRFERGTVRFFSRFLLPIAQPKFPIPLLAERTPGSLLDVGCGDGAVMEFARQLGWRTFGVEVDAAAVVECRKKNLDVIQGSYRSLGGIRERFDCVIASHVIEHVHDPLEFIRLLVSVLSPNGCLFISYPNPRSLMRSVFRKYWRGLEAPRHLVLPSEWKLRDVLNSCGFEVRVHPAPIHTLAQSMSAALPFTSRLAPLFGAVAYGLTSVFPYSSSRQDIVQIVATAHGSSDE